MIKKKIFSYKIKDFSEKNLIFVFCFLTIIGKITMKLQEMQIISHWFWMKV